MAGGRGEEGIGGGGSAGPQPERLEAGDAAIGLAVDDEYALGMCREHGKYNTEAVVEVVDTIQIEIVTSGGKRAFAGVGVAVEHQGDVAGLPAQEVGAAGGAEGHPGGWRWNVNVFKGFKVLKVFKGRGGVEAATGCGGGDVADEGMTVGEDAGGEPLDVEGEEVGDAACCGGLVLDDDSDAYWGICQGSLAEVAAACGGMTLPFKTGDYVAVCRSEWMACDALMPCCKAVGVVGEGYGTAGAIGVVAIWCHQAAKIARRGRMAGRWCRFLEL